MKILFIFILALISSTGFTQETYTFQHDGLTREYIYYQPDNLPANAPLVFVCHPYSGLAEVIMDFSHMNALADEHGFAVCYPQGTVDINGNTFFNVGYTDQDNPTVDDVGFVVALVQHLQDTYQLSSQNTFCTGFSNGADFCYLLACQASTIFRAVAPVSGTMLTDTFENCNPENPIPVFETHGTADLVTFYNGDPNNSGGWGTYPSVPTIINFWSNLNGLTQTATDTLPDIFPGDYTYIIREIHSSPDTNHEVWLYKVFEGGHDWVGSFGNMDVDISQEIWTFFSQYIQNSTDAVEETTKKDTNKKLIKIVDVLGREVEEKPHEVLYYIYDDFSVEKRLIIE